MSKHKTKIILLGSYGRGNVGDDAFLIAITTLASAFDITINAANKLNLPEEVRGKVQTLATDSNWDLFRKVRAFAMTDIVMYGGGDLWVELHGDRMPRRSLWKMLALNAVARVMRKRVYYVGCGAGRLKGLSLWLARASAGLANSILARDSRTVELLMLARAIVLPDITATLFHDPEQAVGQPGKLTVTVSPLYYIPDPGKNFKQYIYGLKKFIEGLPEDKYDVLLLPMMNNDQTAYDDAWVCRELAAMTKRSCRIAEITSVSDCIACLKASSVVIGSRLHADVLSTWLGVPTIGVSYRPKVAQFYKENGIGNECLDYRQLDKLPMAFERLIQEYSQIAARVKNIASTNIAKAKEYDAFFESLA